MKNFKIPFSKSTVGKEEKQAVSKVLDSGWLTTGKLTQQFEEEFAQYVGAKYAVFVNSCTSALALAIQYKKKTAIQPQPKIVVPSLTFAATVNEVINAGCKPIFVDVNKDDFCLDYNLAHEEMRRQLIDIVLPVHLTGNKAEGYGDITIYDSAHRIERNEAKDGIWCYSFYPTKNMTTGEGGMIATNSEDAYKWFKQARHHGISKSLIERYGNKNDWAYEVEFVGWKANNTDIAAAMGIEQLKKLDWMNERRNEIVSDYNKELGYKRTGNHLYPVLVKDRTKFIDKMKKEGIQCSVHFLPLHKMKAFNEMKAFDDYYKFLPVTEDLGEKLVSLPLYPTLTKKEVKLICDTAKKTKLLI